MTPSTGKLLYLHHILRKKYTELEKQVLRALQADTTKGDFIDLIRNDMDMVGDEYYEENMVTKTKSEFK